jgi:hypothetical protein
VIKGGGHGEIVRADGKEIVLLSSPLLFLIVDLLNQTNKGGK